VTTAQFRIKVMMAQGDAGGRVTLVGIALVIHGAIAAGMIGTKGIQLTA
jgi:hypothetical protein